MKNLTIKNTFALVTGASSGIGLEISRILAEHGYNIFMVSNQEEKLHKLKQELTGNYDISVEVLFTDLARNTAAQELYNHCEYRNIEVEVLINNAGFYFFSEVVEADITKAEKKILLHVLTFSQLCTLFGKEMKERRKGYIMNISSISAYKAFPGIAHYGATKCYIKYFTRSLRTELNEHNVNVSCLCPGATLTNLYDSNVINIKTAKKFGIMMSAKKVAKRGINRLFKNKGFTMPGFITRLTTFFTILAPQFVVVGLWKRHKSKWVK